jgi:CDP-2,3-bis-(O-geranylgeranyl)-sn-glycerol synthase
MNILFAVISIIYLFLPAAAANMFAALSAKLIPTWNYPLDGYKNFHGKRILGDHKTVRGIVIGILAATLIFMIQKYLFFASPAIRSIALINYFNEPFVLGTLFGMGALAGDTVKSFFKRRANHKPGQAWFPYDQIDWVVGALLFTIFSIHYSGLVILLTLCIFLVLHIIVKFIGYLLKLDKEPF